MPGKMDGLELAQIVHRRWPPVRLLLTSGNHIPSIETPPQRGYFIRKPWKPQSLMERVEEVFRISKVRAFIGKHEIVLTHVNF